MSIRACDNGAEGEEDPTMNAFQSDVVLDIDCILQFMHEYSTNLPSLTSSPSLEDRRSLCLMMLSSFD